MDIAALRLEASREYEEEERLRTVHGSWSSAIHYTKSYKARLLCNISFLHLISTHEDLCEKCAGKEFLSFLITKALTTTRLSINQSTTKSYLAGRWLSNSMKDKSMLRQVLRQFLRSNKLLFFILGSAASLF